VLLNRFLSAQATIIITKKPQGLFNMRIAVVHDWLTVYAGAERVLAALLGIYPTADLFCVVDFLPQADRGFLNKINVTTSFIQKLPWAKKYYRNYLSLMPLAIEQLDLSSYDLVISNSHAVAKGVLTGPHQLHISYINSPIRYAWDLQNQYLQEANLTRGLKSKVARIMLHRIRMWDQLSASRPDYLIANSKFIAARIEKTWRRSSSVIYPPVDIHKFTLTEKKENFFLTASRLVPYKKINLIVESFASMPDKKLIVIGDGPDFAKIKKIAKSNVELLGFQSNQVLADYMQRAQAFIFAAEEDFGIVPLEAQACATPVIAFGRGGALETVRGLEQENPTGIFFREQSVESICQAINLFEQNKDIFKLDNFSQHVVNFSPDIFKQKIREFVDGKLVKA